MLSAFKVWFTALSTLAKVTVVSAAVITGGAANAAVNSNSQASVAHSPTSNVSKEVQAPCVPTVSNPAETKLVPFTKTTIDDANTSQGKSYIKTVGVEGTITTVYEVTTYSPAGCEEDTKVAKSTETTTQPVTEVTAVGTYVAPQVTCSNGSYTNVDGNVVCSPSASSAGASAKCVDGTYSYSLNRSGTCSHHGGVAIWY